MEFQVNTADYKQQVHVYQVVKSKESNTEAKLDAIIEELRIIELKLITRNVPVEQAILSKISRELSQITSDVLIDDKVKLTSAIQKKMRIAGERNLSVLKLQNEALLNGLR